MNTQEILTSVIEFIFWVTVSFMLSQFITGLSVLRRKSYTVIQAQTTTVTPNLTAMSFDKPQSIYAPDTYCCEELPDPWTLENEVVECNSNQSNQIVISSPTFPTLKLLTAVKEIQPQPKRTNRTKKTSQPKSPNKSRTNKSTTPRKPVRPRKKVA